MSFQFRCRALRTALGLSCRGMSAKLHLSNTVWSLYEAGKKEPGLSTLSALAALGVDLNWLVTGDGNMLRTSVSVTPDTDSTRSSATREQRLKAIVARVRELLADSDVGNLSLWAQLIEVLASHKTGLTLEELRINVSAKSADQVRQNLEFLQAEGIVTCSRGVYRLLVVSKTHRTTDYELQLLLAIREILEGIMPASKVDAKRAILRVAQKDVVAGQGDNLFHEMRRILDQFDQHSEPMSTKSGTEVVRVVIAGAIHPRPGNPP